MKRLKCSKLFRMKGQVAMRRLLVMLLCVCFLILPGCGAENPQNGVSRTSEISETMMENIRRDERIENLLPKTVKTLDEEEHVYDLGALIPEQEGMLLWDYAVTEKGKVLLLYGNSLMEDGVDPYADGYYDEFDYDAGGYSGDDSWNDPWGDHGEAGAEDLSDGMEDGASNYSEEPCRFTILSLDVITGEVTTLVENRDAEIPGEESYLFSPTFVGIDPVIVSENCLGAFYDLEKDQVTHLSMEEEGFILQFLPQKDGRVYFLDPDKNIYELCRDASGFTSELRWSVEEGCNFYEVFRLSEDELTFSARPELDEPDRSVYLRVNLSAGKTEEIYTADYACSLYEDGNLLDQRLLTAYGYTGVDALFLEESGKLRYSLGQKKDETEEDGAIQGPDLSSYGFDGGYSISRFPSGDGCLFVRIYNENTPRLLMWIYERGEAEKITEPEHVPYKVLRISDVDLSGMKKELEESFGIRVYAGADARLDFVDYIAEAETDPKLIYQAYLQIRACYSQYPKGFMEQLYGNDSPLKVHIVRQLSGAGEGTISSAGGLQSSDEEGTYIALATGGVMLDDETIYHETTHAVYDKLTEDGFMDDFYEDWAKLNPPDFGYAYTYEDEGAPDSTYTCYDDGAGEDYENVYFVRDYSKTFETEDVADLFGNLMKGDAPPEYFGGVHMQAKCSYFSKLIRKGFDTTGWPEKTGWEERLESVAP